MTDFHGKDADASVASFLQHDKGLGCQGREAGRLHVLLFIAVFFGRPASLPPYQNDLSSRSRLSSGEGSTSSPWNAGYKKIHEIISISS
jgi:hypothetical protein